MSALQSIYCFESFLWIEEQSGRKREFLPTQQTTTTRQTGQQERKGRSRSVRVFANDMAANTAARRKRQTFDELTQCPGLSQVHIQYKSTHTAMCTHARTSTL